MEFSSRKLKYYTVLIFLRINKNDSLLQRYYYYIQKGVHKDMLAGQPPEQLQAIQRLVPEKYLTSSFLSGLRDKLLEEIDQAYDFSARKAIG